MTWRCRRRLARAEVTEGSTFRSTRPEADLAGFLPEAFVDLTSPRQSSVHEHVSTSLADHF